MSYARYFQVTATTSDIHDIVTALSAHGMHRGEAGAVLRILCNAASLFPITAMPEGLLLFEDVKTLLRICAKMPRDRARKFISAFIETVSGDPNWTDQSKRPDVWTQAIRSANLRVS